MAWARIVHHWDDESATSLEVGSDEPAHPDLLDELTARVLVMWPWSRTMASTEVRDG